VVDSVYLRRPGLRGPRGSIDGLWVVCRVMSADALLECLERRLGEGYEFESMTLKPYPTCRYTHGPIEVLLELRERHSLHADEIAGVEIATFRESIEVSDKPIIRSRFDAILSHQYTAALALLDGSVPLASFDDRRIHDPALQNFLERVHIVYDASLQTAYPQTCPHLVTISMSDGRRLGAESTLPPGGRSTPMSPAAVESKFLTLATPILGDATAVEAMMTILRLEDCSEIGALTRLLSR